MKNHNELKALIALSGYKLSFLANKIGVTRYSLTNKLNGITDFKSEEIKKLAEILNIKNEEIYIYFFSDN